MANKSKQQVIETNIENIEQWISKGYTVESIARTLGVSRTTLYKYLNLDKTNTIKKNREPLVQNLENTLYESATGYERTVKKYAKLKRCSYNENGKKDYEWEEMVEYEETVYYPPEISASIFLLKNWGKYMNEPQMIDVRKRELKLKEKSSW